MKQLIIFCIFTLFTFTLPAQVEGVFEFSEEQFYTFNGLSYQYQSSRWWTTYIECNDAYCIVDGKMYTFEGEGRMNGKPVSVYKTPMEAEFIIYKDGRAAILNYEFVNGFYLTKKVFRK